MRLAVDPYIMASVAFVSYSARSLRLLVTSQEYGPVAYAGSAALQQAIGSHARYQAAFAYKDAILDARTQALNVVAEIEKVKSSPEVQLKTIRLLGPTSREIDAMLQAIDLTNPLGCLRDDFLQMQTVWPPQDPCLQDSVSNPCDSTCTAAAGE